MLQSTREKILKTGVKVTKNTWAFYSPSACKRITKTLFSAAYKGKATAGYKTQKKALEQLKNL